MYKALKIRLYPTVKQQKMLDNHFDNFGGQKEEAKTVEGKTPEEIFRKVIFSDMENISVAYDDRGKRQILEAMQAYSSQQNTALVEENERLREVLESFVNDYALGYKVMTDFMISQANEALKPKQ